ncbi:MAG: hypothetical protein JSU01_05965 [Bacteroidetes bacterium]|nr:hypothetical protein [Bacteroidota bacterium]
MIKTKPLLVLLALIASSLAVKAQEKVPMIKGNVDISVTKGTIACDFVLTNLPTIRNYVIRLNSGMNIHYFRDEKRGPGALDYDVDTKDSIQSDEVKSYFVHENRGNPARYIPEELEVKYVGMYPVVKDSASGYMGGDWRGNVAFNGYSVRADGFQSCWYPVLYDKDTRKRNELVRYDVKVTCNDCDVLFVNGSSPVKAKQATFMSDVPHEMSMFCGRFETAEQNGVWLLNAGMTKEDEAKFFSTANAYEAYYAKQMNIPFKGTLTFVQTDPVADPSKWAFAFFSAPTTFNVGVGKWGLQSLFSSGNSARNKKSMAHELAHYYFGTMVRPGSEFGHVIEEGLAEYMALKLTRSIEGEDVFQSLLNERVQSLKYLHNYKPFSQVKTESDYGNREYYLYYYAPALFTAVEKEIGEAAMWQWLRMMALSKNDHSDYNFMADAFKNTVTDNALQQKIIGKYFESPDALKNTKEELGLN